MGDWKDQFKYDPIKPFLLINNKPVLFFIQRDLLDEEAESAEILWRLPEVEKILDKQQDNGSWKYPGKSVDAKQDYNQLETFRNLAVLIEKYGFNNNHPAIKNAAIYLYSCQTEEGDFRGIYASQYTQTYSAGIMELLIKAGYGDDPRIKKGFEWFLSTRQNDGGWASPIRTTETSWKNAYEMSEPLQPNKNKPFSHLITGMVLRPFAAHKVYRNNKEAKEAGELLTSRFFKNDKYSDRRDKEYWLKFSFPFWFTDLLSALDSLYFLGFRKKSPMIQKALDWFKDHQKDDGLWDLNLLRSKDKALKLWISYVICRTFKRYYS